jgi:prolyl-tRNA editing enzyme YbaK/EbsC (Cys-tRNA(Pro) deacylase)
MRVAMTDDAPPREEHRSLPRAAQRVASELAARGHHGAVRILPDSARSAAEAAAALGVEQRLIVKSLVFRSHDSGRPVLALVGGTSRVDTDRLAQRIGERAVRADADWVREVTGYAIGGIPPIAHAQPILTIADPSLVSERELWAAAGTPHAVFALSGAELVPLTGARLGPIADGPPDTGPSPAEAGA